MTPDPSDMDPAARTPRRPQWRGERQAVLVRLPVAVAEQLRAEAGRSNRSVSDAAASFISQGMAGARP